MENEQKKKVAILIPEKEPVKQEPTHSMIRKGVMKRAEWLSFCLSIGWQKDQLDGLGDIWDKHHDEAGNLTTSEPVGKLEEKEERRFTKSEIIEIFNEYSEYMNDHEQHEGNRKEFSEWFDDEIIQ